MLITEIIRIVAQDKHDLFHISSASLDAADQVYPFDCKTLHIIDFDVSVYTLEVQDPSDIGDVSFTDDSYYIDNPDGSVDGSGNPVKLRSPIIMVMRILLPMRQEMRISLLTRMMPDTILPICVSWMYQQLTGDGFDGIDSLEYRIDGFHIIDY